MLRSHRRHRLLLTSLALVVALDGHAKANDRKLPDPSTGAINGRAALLYWPVLPAPEGREPELLAAEGCRVHLVSVDDPAVEHRYPCGQWFQPTSGAYDAWLETADRVSPPWTVRYGGEPAQSGLAAVVPMFPAGRVAIPAGRTLPAGEELRLLSLDGHQTMKSGRIFERRVRRDDAGGAVLMPAGRIVAGRFEAKGGDAIALSRPVVLDAGRTVSVWPEAPAEGSDLLVILRKPSRSAASAETALFVDDGAHHRAADVTLDANRIVAIWYGLGARCQKQHADRGSHRPRRQRLARRGGHGTIAARHTRHRRLRIGGAATAPRGTPAADRNSQGIRRRTTRARRAAGRRGAARAHAYAAG